MTPGRLERDRLERERTRNQTTINERSTSPTASEKLKRGLTMLDSQSSKGSIEYGSDYEYSLDEATGEKRYRKKLTE